MENVRRFDLFDTVSDVSLIKLRDFFLVHIYPPPQEREELDEAFDRLRSTLHNPKQMAPFMGSALKSLWRLGAKLPTAVKAGRSAIDAYAKTRTMESSLVDVAMENSVSLAATQDRAIMVGLIAHVPEKDILKLIKDVLELFKALSEVEMLEVAVTFMEKCIQIMHDHKELYDESDIQGIGLGLLVLKQGVALFQEQEPKSFPVIIEGIRAVELDWFESIQKESKK